MSKWMRTVSVLAERVREGWPRVARLLPRRRPSRQPDEREVEDRLVELRRLEGELVLWELAQGLLGLGAAQSDVNTGEATWSPGMFRITGQDPATFTPTLDSALAMIHPDDRELAEHNAVQAATSTERVVDQRQLRIVRPSGEVRWVDMRSVRMGDGRALATFLDITDVRAIEQGRQAEAQRLQLAVELAQLGAWEVTLHDNVVVWSPEIYRILGRDPATYRPDLQSVLNAVHPDHHETVGSTWTMVKRGLPTPHEVRIIRPSGEVRWVRFASMLVGEDRVVGFLQDVTERKRAEQVLRDQGHEIQRANQAKTEFLSRMSHELRTPLHAVLGYGQLLELDGLEPPQDEAVEHILRAGRHLLALIDEVLDISALETGALTFSIEPFEVRTVIEEAIRLVLPSASAAAIEVLGPSSTGPSSAGPIDGSPTVFADRVRTQQILLNLLSNAIKYNRPEGRVTVTVDTRDHAVDIAVRDTGEGIPPDQLPRVFEPFDRLGADQLGIQGTGIGLALARSLAERMDGSIAVTSTVGEGSTFTLTLPAGVPDDEDGEAAHAGLVRDRNRPAVPITVVNIEDNPANRQLVAAVLRRRDDIRLIEAPDGASGLRLTREHDADLVLLDMHLPDIDGIEIIRRLSARPRDEQPSIIVLSADANRAQVELALALGADHYLTKPVDLQRLLEVIELAQQRAAQRGIRRD